MSDPADHRPPECGTDTPTGRCVLPAGHPPITVLPTAHEGHMSQSAADQNERDVFGPKGMGEILVGGVAVPGAVTTTPEGVTMLDLAVVADEIERRAHARGELAPWEEPNAVPDPTVVAESHAIELFSPGDEIRLSAQGEFNPDPSGVVVTTSTEVVEPDLQCVAATGLMSTADPCRVHPDGAHRCHRAPEHQAPSDAGQNLLPGRSLADHICDCGFVWLSYRGGAEQQGADLKAASDASAERVLSRMLRAFDDYGGSAATVERVGKEMGIAL